ncbi:hypothetical protein E2C01_036426 [Portunus trituberculatus]|uniref:Uncharacterized protein n=1 Tax=Portunus trituberculatus TaxID=210409 RepID=A0A5B7FBC3_PORTR|nr:hypothetical protein [Portunus trituberculatus]
MNERRLQHRLLLGWCGRHAELRRCFEELAQREAKGREKGDGVTGRASLVGERDGERGEQISGSDGLASTGRAGVAGPAVWLGTGTARLAPPKPPLCHRHLYFRQQGE